MVKRKTITGMQSLGKILKSWDYSKKKYITREFQDYGYRLACELDEEKRASLFIKMAKELPRDILERAKNFVKDATNVKSKGRLFMWKVQQLKKEKKNEKS